jgi:hypothetical protein
VLVRDQATESNQVILIAADTTDGSDSCKLFVVLQHSRGARVWTDIVAFYSADKIYHLSFKMF